MSTSIHTIGGATHPPAGFGPSPVPAAAYRSSVHTVAGERITCVVLRRDDPTAAADHRIGLAARLPFAPVLLLQQKRGFLDALSRIYGVDLGDGFDQVVCLQKLDTTRAFAADSTYRRTVVEHLCHGTLDDAGFVAIQPASGMWRRIRGDAKMAPSANQTLALCHLFGACGFAQLCDDELLDRPVPVFLQPWSRQHGLLSPRHSPREPFSRSMCVQRLRPGRMVLFDRA
jgi:hypothetical protein